MKRARCTRCGRCWQRPIFAACALAVDSLRIVEEKLENRLSSGDNFLCIFVYLSRYCRRPLCVSSELILDKILSLAAW